MIKVKYANEVIPVSVNGELYEFHPVEELKDVGINNLVIMHFNKKSGECTHIWECKAEISYELQQHMENVLVSDRNKFFNKNYGMIRLTSCDDNSFSLTGPNKQTIHLVKMGGRYYTTKLN